MKLVFRWYGQSDPVTLDQIRQIPEPSERVWFKRDLVQSKTGIKL